MIRDLCAAHVDMHSRIPPPFAVRGARAPVARVVQLELVPWRATLRICGMVCLRLLLFRLASEFFLTVEMLVGGVPIRSVLPPLRKV